MWLASTPKNVRERQEWNPSPVLGEETSRQNLEETLEEISGEKSKPNTKSRRQITEEKYKAAKKKIRKYLQEDEKLLVNYTELELSEDKIRVGWFGKNYVPDRRNINRLDVEVGLSR